MLKVAELRSSKVRFVHEAGLDSIGLNLYLNPKLKAKVHAFELTHVCLLSSAGFA